MDNMFADALSSFLGFLDRVRTDDVRMHRAGQNCQLEAAQLLNGYGCALLVDPCTYSTGTPRSSHCFAVFYGDHKSLIVVFTHHLCCRIHRIVIVNMKVSAAVLSMIIASANASVTSLTPANYESLTEGKTVFLKFFAPW
jgi:hypothetical protein